MLLAAAAALGVASAASSYPSFAELSGKPYNVTYDERALKIDGEHALFVSGAVHPPRGSPAMWRTWLAEAKANGLNMVQVYIFWNYHEPEEDVMDFGGVQANANLTLFMHEASAAGLFVNLRVGPYVCAEWTYGGIPAWLGQKPGVKFRQTNAVWQPAMKKFFGQIIDLMADGSFFASQGGPIMLVQVENELPKTARNALPPPPPAAAAAAAAAALLHTGGCCCCS
jgi:beta-galactosidase GanA